MTLSYSPLASKVAGVRDPKLAVLRNTPWGFLLHTTGGGVTDAAKKKGITPIAEAIAVYIASQNGSNGYKWGGPHYVIDHDGQIYQVAPDEAETAHCGAPGVRDHYLDGSWAGMLPAAVVRQWQAKWPHYVHPYQLFPSKTPNWDFVGCEMIPIGDGFGGPPMAPGLRFTKAQHDSAIALASDVGHRHGLPASWAASCRLLGHEDVDPISRHDALGGWDPGYLRAAPYFDFAYVRAGVAATTP